MLEPRHVNKCTEPTARAKLAYPIQERSGWATGSPESADATLRTATNASRTDASACFNLSTRSFAKEPTMQTQQNRTKTSKPHKLRM